MTRMTPSEAFVETLAAHGVTIVFGIVGSFIDNPSFAKVARAKVAEGIKVDHADRIRDALKKSVRMFDKYKAYGA